MSCYSKILHGRISADHHGSEGPTGRYVLVEEAVYLDYGDNVLASATTLDEVRNAPIWRAGRLKTPGRWVPRRTGRVLERDEIGELHIG